MIIDTLENAAKYYGLHPSFAEAFGYLIHNNLLLSEVKEVVVSANVTVKEMATFQGKTKEESLKTFECHNANIDIQVCLKGVETMGWKPRKKCISPKGEYSKDNDVLFFNDEPDMYFQLKEGQFAVFFSEDVHAPMIGNGEIKKVVVKVKI